MFDLEQSIRRWRRAMSARLPLHRGAIDELEMHLRDAVKDQVQVGVAPEEAWKLAVARLGTPEAIATEFGKLPAHAIWRWLPAKVVLGVFAAFAALLAWFVGSRMMVGKTDILLGLHVLAITLGYTSLLMVGAVAAWSVLSRAMCGWSQVETQALRATIRWMAAAGLALTLLGIVLGSFWARNHLGRYWDWHPKEVCGAAILAWNVLVVWLLVGSRDERTMMSLGLAGTIIVALSWFVPVATTWGSIAVGLAGLAIVQLALLGLAFVRPARLGFWSTQC